MRTRIVLAIILLAVGLCFEPTLGYGEVFTPIDEMEMELEFLRIRVDYIMQNPTDFLDVRIGYDKDGHLAEIMELPLEVSTRGKICISIIDNRGIFRDKSRLALVMQFKKQLEKVYSFINYMAPVMFEDVVAKFKLGKHPVGYYYEGEYHLWER